ncbi:MAG: adenylosuccinate synthase [Kiritimatiellia bacterium]
MPATVLVGLQWGDEGKGKVCHLLSGQMDWIARFQGGHNAGHTIVFDGKKYVLHLVPGGILYPKKKCAIGSGVVVDPVALVEELDLLREKGIKVKGRLFIAPQCHLIFPYHQYMDACREDLKTRIGTTKRGIGPAYGDKAARVGIRMADYLEDDLFRDLLRGNLAEKAPYLKGRTSLRALEKRILADRKRILPRIKDYIADVSLLLANELDRGRHILFEGAQGAMLDCDYGTYPFVTSSSPVSGGACTGCGIAPTRISKIIGITKAYTTRVGLGPFPTEIEGNLADELRAVGSEYGATTGRPRRIGWLDMVQLRMAVRINGASHIALMKMDVLDSMKEIKICTGYRYRGKILGEFPASRTVIEKVTPVYESLPGWQKSTAGISSFAKLPPAARRFVRRVEELSGTKVVLLSLGPARDDTIVLKDWFKHD